MFEFFHSSNPAVEHFVNRVAGASLYRKWEKFNKIYEKKCDKIKPLASPPSGPPAPSSGSSS